MIEDFQMQFEKSFGSKSVSPTPADKDANSNVRPCGEGIGMTIEDFDLPPLVDADEADVQASLQRYRARLALARK